jgi:hypothetical protein
MQIFVSYIGEMVALHVETSDTIEEVQRKIQEQIGVPADKQRLFYKGIHLMEGLGETLTDYDIEKEFILDLVTRRSTSPSNHLVDFMWLSDAERSSVPAPLEKLRQRAIVSKVDEFRTFKSTKDKIILDQTVCERLSTFLEFMWHLTLAASPNKADMLMDIAFSDFTSLVGADANEITRDGSNILASLVALLGKIPETKTNLSKISITMRMTRGISNASVEDFHCNGAHNTGTVDLSLNKPEEYSGGRQCFFVNGHLHVLDHPLGSFSQYPGDVLQGLTALTEGTRKKIYVSNHNNRLNTVNSARAFVKARSHHVQAFLVAYCAVQNSDTSDKKSKHHG